MPPSRKARIGISNEKNATRKSRAGCRLCPAEARYSHSFIARSLRRLPPEQYKKTAARFSGPAAVLAIVWRIIQFSYCIIALLSLLTASRGRSAAPTRPIRRRNRGRIARMWQNCLGNAMFVSDSIRPTRTTAAIRQTRCVIYGANTARRNCPPRNRGIHKTAFYNNKLPPAPSRTPTRERGPYQDYIPHTPRACRQRHECPRISRGYGCRMVEIESVAGSGNLSAAGIQSDSLFSSEIEERNIIRCDMLPGIDIEINVWRAVSDVREFHFQISFCVIPTVMCRPVGYYQ